MIEGKDSAPGVKSLTCGMIGGGQGAFIGDVHRKAVAMDRGAVLSAGCFSQDADNTLRTGLLLGLDRDRLYRTYGDLLEGEAKREDRIDFVIIVTPNHTHFPIAELALQKGFHVVCDKPLTTDSREAQKLADMSREKDLLFCVTYAYAGYPIVKHIRDIIARGDLGEIRFVQAEYPQDWLATPLEKTGQKQSLWRTDPARAGLSNCVGDIGSHIENMVAVMTGLSIHSLCARLDIFGEDRVLDDNASILVNYEGGAKGLYWSSQIAVGNDNGFRVRIFGTRASVDWNQEQPNYCRMGFIDKPTEILSRGRDDLTPSAARYIRIPSGHPEGYYEAFANIYATFTGALAKKKAGEPLCASDLDFPDVDEGVRGVRYIEKCVESSKKGSVWVELTGKK
ncbi:MAG: Gfo/Idh/MocA family oxidoreductase [Acidobacteria bacterium]|nr:Gfo/Idh/MocA family oxidoreductase [Acidobacteriota bacterium]MBU1474655.1 Gfo/Idh/MocA family oxidoreductase [Acidobacteriota bacterium]